MTTKKDDLNGDGQQATLVVGNNWHDIAGLDGREKIIVDVSSSDEVGGKIVYRLCNGKMEKIMASDRQP